MNKILMILMGLLIVNTNNTMAGRSNNGSLDTESEKPDTRPLRVRNGDDGHSLKSGLSRFSKASTVVVTEEELANREKITTEQAERLGRILEKLNKEKVRREEAEQNAKEAKKRAKAQAKEIEARDAEIEARDAEIEALKAQLAAAQSETLAAARGGTDLERVMTAELEAMRARAEVAEQKAIKYEAMLLDNINKQVKELLVLIGDEEGLPGPITPRKIPKALSVLDVTKSTRRGIEATFAVKDTYRKVSKALLSSPVAELDEDNSEGDRVPFAACNVKLRDKIKELTVKIKDPFASKDARLQVLRELRDCLTDLELRAIAHGECVVGAEAGIESEDKITQVHKEFIKEQVNELIALYQNK